MPFTRGWRVEGTFGLDACKNCTKKYSWEVTKRVLRYASKVHPDEGTKKFDAELSNSHLAIVSMISKILFDRLADVA